MREPGRLLSSGRDSDIFDYGTGLVLRRARSGRSLEKEAKVMRYVAARGYPAPRVEELSADGASLVMHRIEGPTMVEARASCRCEGCKRLSAELFVACSCARSSATSILVRFGPFCPLSPTGSAETRIWDRLKSLSCDGWLTVNHTDGSGRSAPGAGRARWPTNP